MSEGSCLINQVPSRAFQLQQFLDNIPVGIQKCKNDAYFTILDVNQGFLFMTGYSKEEIRAIFHDRYIDMIYPEDRQTTVNVISTQLLSGNQIEVEYRILCKNGKLRWVLDKGVLISDENGQTIFCCALTDITTLHETREQLRLSLERHKIILDQTNDIIFEWDIKNDCITYSSNWENKFGYEPIQQKIKAIIPNYSHIYPEDRSAFSTLMERLGSSVPFAAAEFRIKNAADQYIWCRVRATNQFDDQGHVIKAIGVITDIDEEKKMIESLRSKAEHDPLTGLYDKVTLTSQIEEFLTVSSDTQCAFFMVDIDNFKALNDTKGHLFGDAVLSELSAGIRRVVRSSDLVGRIGGDEFAIFLKNIPSELFCLQKAEQILNFSQNLLQGQKQSVEISCSIGIALFPAHGRCFQQLYESADIALYQAKRRGKNCCSVFCQNMCLPDMKVPVFTRHEISEIPERRLIFPGLAEFVFQTLYSANDLSTAISLVLEIIGKHFDVSRVYIFENSPDNQTSSNTFEWCAEGIEPVKDQMQKLPCDLVGDYAANFDSKGVFYCKDVSCLSDEQREIMESQNIRSLLQCTLKHNGIIRGFVGFDECTGQRFWAEEEISILNFVSKLLSIFLFRY